jgi:hypothetical protein
MALMHVPDKDLVSVLSQQVGAPPLAAAVYARVTSPASFTRRLGPLGNYLLARPAARAAAHRVSERTDGRWTLLSSSAWHPVRFMCGQPTR